MRAAEFVAIATSEFAPGEQERIERALAELKRALGSPDRRAIQEATHELNEATRHLAEVSMNRSLQAALSGRSIDQV
jgi:molecular chaperone HscA